ncbi:MAG: cytochrome-c oxidase [Ramlibacter sp.]|nr:cytochrome-c oxidase [Ramlibacter sp.]
MACDRVRRLLLLAAPAALLAQLPANSAGAPRELRMVARKFAFEPATISVRVGDPVVLRLRAPEVPMGFNLPDFGVRADIVPGQEAVVRFTPDRAGSFTFLCDVFCGNGHEDMSGTLVVTA